MSYIINMFGISIDRETWWDRVKHDIRPINCAKTMEEWLSKKACKKIEVYDVSDSIIVGSHVKSEVDKAEVAKILEELKGHFHLDECGNACQIYREEIDEFPEKS